MDPAPLYPLRFEPILKRLLWGGRRLGSVLNKPLGPEADYAESWEIADHRQDVSQVANGPLAGQSLRDLMKARGADVMGEALAATKQFPLLVKFLDAHQHLSVQVHPDDEKGRIFAEDNGKTEAWVVLHAEPGSLIYCGLKPGVTREAFAHAMESGDVEPLLHRFEPKSGDCVMIPSGTVHAIGAGIVLAEIQQMSDATFRVYDWGRVGADGKPRTLHKLQALESTNFELGAVNPMQVSVETISGGTREALASCEFFGIQRLKLTDQSTVGTDRTFTLLLCMDGDAEIEHSGQQHPIAAGQTYLLPAQVGPCSVKPRGEVTLLTCVVP